MAAATSAGVLAAAFPTGGRHVSAQGGHRTFLLVHGGWHGGWCWAKVAPAIRAEGHSVYTPSLTGLGERAHLLAPDIDLETHVQDILGVLEYEDLRSVVLVGHSYGGMVISAVANRMPERVAEVVFLDAFVPADGQSALDLLAPERAEQLREQARRQGDGWRVPAPAPERYGITDPDDLAWVRPRLGPQPLATLEQPVRLSSALDVPRTYIACTEFDAFRGFADAARADSATWRYAEIASGHDAMIVKPRELAALLVSVGHTSA